MVISFESRMSFSHEFGTTSSCNGNTSQFELFCALLCLVSQHPSQYKEPTRCKLITHYTDKPGPIDAELRRLFQSKTDLLAAFRVQFSLYNLNGSLPLLLTIHHIETSEVYCLLHALRNTIFRSEPWLHQHYCVPFATYHIYTLLSKSSTSPTRYCFKVEFLVQCHRFRYFEHKNV